MEEQETRSGFLLKNFIRGIVWLVIVVVAFVFAEEYIQDNFQRDIVHLQNRPLILYSIFFGSEVVFGLIPPVLFMTTWKLILRVDLYDYVLNLGIMTILSFIAGVIGFYVGRLFSKTKLYRRMEVRYLRQYNQQLKKYGSFLVIVGALTPIPFSATCMMAGSVNIPVKEFLWVCATRIFYFLIYGWIVWSFPTVFA